MRKQITARSRAASVVAGNSDRQKRMHETSYESIANALNLSRTTLSNRMKHPETFTLAEIFTLAQFFRVDVAEIIIGG